MQYNKFQSQERLVALTEEAREAWSTWLSAEPWDVFMTMTDAGYPHPESLEKRWRFLETSMNEKLYGRHFRRRGQGIETVIGLEKQKRGSLHVHGLIRLPDHDVNDPEQFSWKYWQNFAAELCGHRQKDGSFKKGVVDFTIPRSNDDVVQYVTKYVCKGGDLIIGPNFNPNRPQSFSQTLLGVSHGKIEKR